MSDPATSSFPGVRPGLRGEHEFVVTEAMTTAHIGGRRPVVTTPAMIMQMESTAQEVTRPLLDEHHTTVGFEVSIRHRAAVPVGGRVRILAELLEVNGKQLLFKVEARQGDEVVGEGLHRRTIIGLGSLDQREPRVAAPSDGRGRGGAAGAASRRRTTMSARVDPRTGEREKDRPMTVEEEYAATRPRSRELYARATAAMPSGAAHDGRVFSPFPFYVERADGARKWDVDGHAYIDCWSGHGALMLGHNHPATVRAIAEQARRGLHYSACHELELRWAELIRACVPGAERVRFTMTGTETTALAIRVARAFTGRTKIIKFQGHFHGLHDSAVSAVKDPFEIPMSAGVPPEMLSTVLVARHNSLEDVGALMDEHPVAAVILEPAAARSMVAPTNPVFLTALRELTRQRGVILIFDEVVTGFRLAPGGAQEYFGVTADLTCLAKAVAGGLPGAALVGRADVMEAIAFSGDPKRDRTARVADQGTHSATPLIAAAGVAALEVLKTGDVQRHTNRLGDRLREGLTDVLVRRDVPGCVYGFASIFRIFLGADRHALGLDTWALDEARLERGMGALGARLHLAMLLNGVDYNRGSAIGWLNGAMTDADVDQVIDAFDSSLVRLREDGAL